MNAINTLNTTYKRLLVKAKRCLDDIDFYMLLSKRLPKDFPCFNTVKAAKTRADMPEIIYNLYEGECAESLRILLAFAFAAPTWYGVYDKQTSSFEIRTEITWGETRFLIRILGVFSAYYTFNPERVEGNLIIGSIKTRHFHPLTQIRPDILTAIFVSRAKECHDTAQSLIDAAQTLYKAANVLETMGETDAETIEIPDQQGD
jgi:hypothetical protein